MMPRRIEALDPPARRPSRRALAHGEAEYEPSDHVVDARRVLAAWLVLVLLGALAVEVLPRGAGFGRAGGLVEAGPGPVASAVDPDAALRRWTSWSRE
jgi:hypothetical protein